MLQILWAKKRTFSLHFQNDLLQTGAAFCILFFQRGRFEINTVDITQQFGEFLILNIPSHIVRRQSRKWKKTFLWPYLMMMVLILMTE